MPTYAYVCKDCAHAFDVQQSFTDDALTICPECGGSLRKQFGAVGVVFKGSGFYKTDSRDAAKKTTSSSAKDTTTKSTDSSSTSTSTTSGDSSSSTAAAPAKSSSDGSAA